MITHCLKDSDSLRRLRHVQVPPKLQALRRPGLPWQRGQEPQAPLASSVALHSHIEHDRLAQTLYWEWINWDTACLQTVSQLILCLAKYCVIDFTRWGQNPFQCVHKKWDQRGLLGIELTINKPTLRTPSMRTSRSANGPLMLKALAAGIPA